MEELQHVLWIASLFSALGSAGCVHVGLRGIEVKLEKSMV